MYCFWDFVIVFCLFKTITRFLDWISEWIYNISITLHGFLMIFFLVMPGLFGGFGNYFVPIFQGSPEVVYPRVNNFSILILILSYLFVILSLIIFSLYFTEDFRGVLKRKKIIKDEWCVRRPKACNNKIKKCVTKR